MLPAGTENGCPRLAFTCPPAEASFRYRIHAGDALSGYYNVQVVPPPTAQDVQMRYDYPAYTSLPPRIEHAAGDIQAVVGSKVTLNIRTNKPLRHAQLIVRSQIDQNSDATLSADGTEATITTELGPQLAGRWSIRLNDADGFEGLLPWRSIRSLPDDPPTARILAPTEPSLHLGRDDRLPLLYAVGDDYGISACQLVLRTELGPLTPIDLPPPHAGSKAQRAWEGRHLLDLSQLRLADARTLTVQVRALDNLPPPRGPQEGLSDPITIQLDAAAPSYVVQVEMAHELRIRAVLEEVLKHLNDAKTESSPLQKVLARLEALNDPALQRIERLRKCLADAETPLRDLIQQIAGGNFAPLAIKLTELADDHIAKAASLAGQIKLTDTMKERTARSPTTPTSRSTAPSPSSATCSRTSAS